jgi:phosphoglucosamine mutase
VLHGEPDGSRINVECGSTDLTKLADAVTGEGADLGLAFDGDADRVLAVDERGEEVDGDRILGLAALDLQRRGLLKKSAVVATVMANLGFRRALVDRGIEVLSAPVGDKYVAEAMAANGVALGGEQSGHIIFAEHSTTGDGILTGLQVAHILRESNDEMSKLAHFFEPFPQVLINVRVHSKAGLDDAEPVWSAVREAEARLGDDGRVLLRASGTEPVVRVMVEAADESEARKTAETLAEVVQKAL